MSINFSENGFEIISGFLPETIISSIINEINGSSESYSAHGIRNAEKKFSSINSLIYSDLLIDKATLLLGSKPQLVRAIFFDKTPDKNWLVTWHQDKTISVDRPANISGWGPWSIKDNTHHVQPGIDVLNSMVTFRLHLDDSDENNGCLKVIPKSHQLGIIAQNEIYQITENHNSFICSVKAGDLLIMRPHLLHSSSKSINPKHRRIVHIEYSNYDLPMGLQWA